jgi:hypothetical protein
LGTGFIKTDRWIETVYRSLKQGAGKEIGATHSLSDRQAQSFKQQVAQVWPAF